MPPADSLRTPLRIIAVVNALLALPSPLGIFIGLSLMGGELGGSPSPRAWLLVGALALHIVGGWVLVIGYLRTAFGKHALGPSFWWASVAYNVYVILGGVAVLVLADALNRGALALGTLMLWAAFVGAVSYRMAQRGRAVESA